MKSNYLYPFISIVCVLCFMSCSSEDPQPDLELPRTEIFVCDAADFNNGPFKIIRYDEEGQNPEVFIEDNLSWPQDILFLEDQQVVLISNLSSGRITKYDANTGSYVGNFATNIGGPTRMKIGSDELLYVLQWQGGDEKVLRFELDGTALGPFTSVPVKESIGFDWDSNGNLYVSSFSGASVRKFDANGNDLGIFINTTLQGPTNIWFDNTGSLIINDWQANRISKFDSTGNFQSHLATGLRNVEGVDFFPNRDFLVGIGGSAEVKMFNSSGSFIKTIINGGSGGLKWPNAVRIRHVE